VSSCLQSASATSSWPSPSHGRKSRGVHRHI
jgi:hypothetical protein